MYDEVPHYLSPVILFTNSPASRKLGMLFKGDCVFAMSVGGGIPVGFETQQLCTVLRKGSDESWLLVNILGK